MLAGADMLLAADCAARLIPTFGEIRIGVLTALIGVPFFIWLVLEAAAGGPVADARGGGMIELDDVSVRLGGRLRARSRVNCGWRPAS